MSENVVRKQPRRKLAWVLVSLVALPVVGYAILPSGRGERLYGGALGDSGFRYEVYLAKRIFGLGVPGDGSSGPAWVVVYDGPNSIVFEKKIQTALSEVDFFDGKLCISGEGAWGIDEFRKKN